MGIRFTSRTEYGVNCLVYIARQEKNRPVTIRELVEGQGYSTAFTEKILQRLRGAGIVSSLQGNQGGYVLARDADAISLREIIEVLESSTFEVICEHQKRTRSLAVCSQSGRCGLKPVWRKTKEILDDFYGKVSLASIASGSVDVQSWKLDCSSRRKDVYGT